MIFDKAFINGKVYTMENPYTVAEAMLVHDGKIFETGTTEQISKYDVKQTVDLKGKTVIPGLIDTHCHIPEMVEDGIKADLEHVKSIDEAIEVLKEYAKTLKKGKWIIGRGISSALLKEKRFPNRYELDRVSKDIPIYISAFDGHSSMGNSKIMEFAGIDKNYVPKTGEIIEKDENGEPTGIFKETLITEKLLEKAPPMFENDEEAKEAIHNLLLKSSKMGYTTLHTILNLWPSVISRARLFEEMNSEGTLPMRINMCFCDEYENGMNITSGIGDDMVRLSSCKFFVDGAMSERTAYLSKDYVDKPGCRGTMVHSEEDFEKIVTKAYELGNDVCIHIIGDAALDVVLNLIDKIYNPKQNSRFELIHCAVTRPDQIERLKNMPVIVNKQPIFIKAPTTLKGEEKLGELNKYYHGLKSFTDAGIIVTGGTDGPLSDMNPFMAMECAVTRKGFDEKTVVNPQECIDIYTAVEMFTAKAAYAGREEKKKGMLKEGMLADFIVLDRNIFTVDANDIHDVKVEETYLGGQPLY